MNNQGPDRRTEPSPRVTAFRASLVWVETVAETWRHTPSDPFQYLARERDYAREFKRLSTHEARESAQVELPWRRRDWFWHHYTGMGTSAERARLAWRRVVPLRIASPARLRYSQGVRASTELFVYPHGLALLITLHWNDPGHPQELHEILELARALRYGNVESTGVRGRTLDEVAARVFEGCRRSIWGPRCRACARPSTPFSVFTVVDAVGAELEAAVAPDGAVHRFLNQVSGWSARQREPERLDTCRVSGERNDGHLLYGHPRSRVVWFPEHFSSAERAGRPSHALRHYHRNLTFCSMQVESLGDYLRRARDELFEGGYLSLPQKEYARNVVTSLHRLAEGRPDQTYRSRSPGRQIRDNGLDEPMRVLSNYLFRATSIVSPSGP